MPEVHILVRGKARDFDDIYEGTKLEIIAKRDELVSLVSRRFGICDWEHSSGTVMVGSSEQSSRTVELMLSNDNVIMLTFTGVEKDQVIRFSNDMGLSLLD
jgi:hypothetical protein